MPPIKRRAFVGAALSAVPLLTNAAEGGNSLGRLLITFTPPGLMEPFFREVSKGNSMPIQDPAPWRAHGMELLGPPLPV